MAQKKIVDLPVTSLADTSLVITEEGVTGKSTIAEMRTSIASGLTAAGLGAAPAQLTSVIDSTAARSVASGDNNSVISFDGGAAITVTIDQGTAGDSFLIVQDTTFTVTIVAGAGVTILKNGAIYRRLAC